MAPSQAVPSCPPSSPASILPGILDCPSLNLLAGASGLGKTAFLSSVIAALAQGLPLFGEATSPPPAIGYICTDRPWASAKQWFDVAGVPEIHYYSLIDDRSFDLAQLHGGKQGPAQFQYCVEKLTLPPGSLVIVDPIALFMGGRLNDYTTTSIACIGLQRFLIDAQLTALGVCHTSKLKADVQDRYARPQDRILGSGALLGYSATQMYLMGPDEAGRDDGLFTFIWNPHHRPAAEFLFERDTKTGLFIIDQATNANAETNMPTLPVALNIGTKLDQVLGLLPEDGTPISTATIILKASQLCSRPTLFRYLERLKAAKRIDTPAHGLWCRVVSPLSLVQTPSKPPTDDPDDDPEK